MAAFKTISRPQSKGPNELLPFTVEHVLTGALANTDTLDVSLPPTMNRDYVPVRALVVSPVASSLRTVATIPITSHNVTTGVTRLTAGGAVAAGNVIVIEYLNVSTAAPAINDAIYTTQTV